MKTKSGFIRRKKNKMPGKRGMVWIFLTPSVLGVFFFVLFPFASTVRRSFMDSAGKEFLGISVYRKVVENSAFQRASCNTIKFLIIALPLLMVISFFLALLLYQFNRKSSFFKTALILPVAVPAASVILLWRMVFCQEGILNGLLGIKTDWIFGPQSFFVLIFAYLWKNTGYQMLLWLAAFSGIPDEIYEAAEVDGANWIKKLLYITIPQVKHASFMIFFLALVNSFKVFREAYIVAGSYPNEKIYLLQHLFNHWFLNLDIQKMSSASVLMTVVITMPIVFFLWKREGEAV